MAIAFAATAGPAVAGRNCFTAAFSPFKKFASHFFNPDFVGTGEKEAAYAVTGEDSKTMKPK